MEKFYYVVHEVVPEPDVLPQINVFVAIAFLTQFLPSISYHLLT